MILEVYAKNKKTEVQISSLQKISSIAKNNIEAHIKNALVSDEIKKIILLDLYEEKM